ncbi:hypothetical protein TRVA0_007S03290 [Trichomonascus vanleenenianus]|uniref:Tex1p n=1 Tax=Trichomonascus vanleenenianus TaxID=2268995 RepID=UPI003ECB5A34
MSHNRDSRRRDRPIALQASVNSDSAAEYFSTYRATTYRDLYVSGQNIKNVEWNCLGNRIACSQNDRNIRIWTADRPELKTSLEIRNAHISPIESICWHPVFYDRLASASASERFINIWEVKTRKVLQRIDIVNEPADLVKVRFSRDGEYIAAVFKDNRIQIYRLSDGQLSHEIIESNTNICDVSWSNSSSYIAYSSEDGSISLVQLGESPEPAQVVNTIRGHRSAVSCLEFDPRGVYLATGSNEGVVCLWDLSTWICVRSFAKSDNAISSISFSHDGAFIAIASENNQPIIIADTETGEYPHVFNRTNYAPKPVVSWSPVIYSLAGSGDPYGMCVWSR